MQWRHAATVILATQSSTTTVGIHALVVQRASSARFMPNAYVFPGGTIDQSIDFDKCWSLQQRQLLGIDSESAWINYRQSIDANNTILPAIRELQLKYPSAPIPIQWAFKVCAARELFEECGIVPVVDRRTNQCEIFTAADRPKLAEQQSAVRNNAKLFGQIFDDRYSLNLSAFQLWSDWLTPVFVGDPRRFDTIFYILPIDAPVRPILCDHELQGYEWNAPVELLRRGYDGDRVRIAPPQIYELSRLAQFESIGALRLSMQNAPTCLNRICPQIVYTNDRRVSILPGDGDYVITDGDMVAEQRIDISANQLRERTNVWHRAEFDNYQSAPEWPWMRWHFYTKNVDKRFCPIEPISRP